MKPEVLVRLRKTFGWAWFLGGAATVAVAIVFAFTTLIFIHKAREANGKILELVPTADNENDTINYAPVFIFTAAEGRSYTITSNVSTNPPDFTVGETVKVLYDPRNPAHARLKSTAQLWFMPLICLPLGLFMATIGGVLLWFDRRYRRRLRANAMGTSAAAAMHR